MSLLPGDIILIPDAPFTNYFQVKPRPCIVISGLQFNKEGPDIILAPISSNVRRGDTKQIVIDIKDDSFSGTGLKCTSAVKCGAIFTYSQSLVRRKLGNVKSEILKQIRENVIDLLTND